MTSRRDKVATGTVVDGKVVVEGEALAEGSTVTVVSTQPWLGAPARHGRVQGVRRVTLSRVRYYLYYRMSEGVLEVLACWHTSRARQARLIEKQSRTVQQRFAPDMGWSRIPPRGSAALHPGFYETIPP